MDTHKHTHTQTCACTFWYWYRYVKVQKYVWISQIISKQTKKERGGKKGEKKNIDRFRVTTVK